MPVPGTFEALTPAWLTEAFRASGVLRAAAVRDTRVEPIGIGVGFLGQLARLHLTYDRAEAGAPATAVAKLPSLDPGGLQVCRLFRFYEREVRFYRELAGTLPTRVPRCYASAFDAETDASLMVLEDFGALRMGDDAGGCSAVDAEAAIRNITRVHAAWWRSPKLDRLEWMPVVDDPVHQFSEPAYQGSLDAFLKGFGDALSPKVRAVTERMAPHVIDLLHASAEGPHTLAHGDYRLDNLFFDGADVGADVATIDWQIAYRGPGIFDVAYFLSGCLEPPLRRAHEMRLLRLWYDAVTEGRAAGYSFDDAVLGYRRSVLYCNVYTVIAVGSLAAANERGRAVFGGWLRRRGAAIEDLDAGELIPA